MKMKRLETGELRADDQFILEDQRKNILIDEVFNRSVPCQFLLILQLLHTGKMIGSLYFMVKQ